MKEVILDTAAEFNLDPLVVAAIITVESAGDPWAVRFEPEYKWLYKPHQFAKELKITANTEINLQKFSWGLMQVMGAVAREMGFALPLPMLCFPEQGVRVGCMYFKKLFDKYGLAGALSAYNSGAPDSGVGLKYAAKVKLAMASPVFFS